MKFGEKLQKLRKEKGLSQESFAEMVGVSRQAVSKWESDQTFPETDTLITISDIFGVTVDSLIKDNALHKDESNTTSEIYWSMRGNSYEYKSEKTLFGLPLVHVHVGIGIKKAKGIIAIGNIASGLISIGLISRGILSLGLVSIGVIGLGCFSMQLLLSLGAISIGTFALGAIAIGIFTLGAVSIGMFSIGALSIASHVAIGDRTYGHISIGRIAKGVKVFIDASPRNYPLSMINAEEVRKTIFEEYPKIWPWIVNWLTLFLG